MLRSSSNAVVWHSGFATKKHPWRATGKSSFLRQRQAELFGSCLLSCCCTKDFHHRLPLIGSQWISYINQNIVSWKSTLTWKWAMRFMIIAFQTLSLMFHVGFINTLLAALNYSAVPARVCNEIRDQNHTAKKQQGKKRYISNTQ